MRHRTRTPFVAVAAIVAIMAAGAVIAYVTISGRPATGNWKTAAGVSLQVPTTGTPRLAFTAQPAAGAQIPLQGTFAVSVAIQDGFGTVVTSDSTDSVTLVIGRNPGHAALACAGPGDVRARVSAGVATFTGCAITKAGAGYTLTAASSVSPALKAPANAHLFAVVTGAAARAASTAAPGSGQASTAGRGIPGASRASAAGSGGSPGPGGELAITSPPVSGTATGRPTIGPVTVQLRTTGGVAAGLSFTDMTTGDKRMTADPAVSCTGTVGAASFACLLSPQTPASSGRRPPHRALSPSGSSRCRRRPAG